MTQFDGFDTVENDGCAVCEAMLPEAVDGALTPEEQRVFDMHVAGCVHCSAELAEAQRGVAWLSILKSKTPEPPLGLLERILAETSGAAAASAVAAPIMAAPAVYEEPTYAWAAKQDTGGGWSKRWAETRMKLGEIFSLGNAGMMLQPRLAMTAAMAFFSLALTLNMMGVRLHDVHTADFTPSGMKRTVADVGATATRRFQNLRVVYQMESRVSELRSDEPR
jgi:anti-sigma factor RsiW